MAQVEISVQCTLRLVTDILDLSHTINPMGDRDKNVGMPVWLINALGKPECYIISEKTNYADLKLFIEAKRCYVFKMHTLSH